MDLEQRRGEVEAELERLQREANDAGRRVNALNEKIRISQPGDAKRALQRAVIEANDVQHAANAKRRVLEAELGELRAKIVARALEEKDASRRELNDDAGFWFRRFMLSLQIGHGGAIAVLLSGLEDISKVPDVAEEAYKAGLNFAVGLVAAGTLPVMLWITRRYALGRAAQRLEIATIAIAVFSALTFCSGLWSSLQVVKAAGNVTSSAEAAPALATRSQAEEVH